VPGPYYSQNSTGNPDADAWEAWWLDFFEPARPLLAAAPWVFSRGNHELCSHAGPGWFYFLDASSALPEGGGAQLACPPQDGEGPALPHLRFVPPRVVALDGLALAVLDSANACDDLPNFTGRYAAQLAAVAARLDGADGDAWLVGHRPPWGLDGTAGGPPFGCDGEPGSGPAPAFAAINRTLQCALAAPGAAALPPRLGLSLAGHMHRFESLTFAAGSGLQPVGRRRRRAGRLGGGVRLPRAGAGARRRLAGDDVQPRPGGLAAGRAGLRRGGTAAVPLRRGAAVGRPQGSPESAEPCGFAKRPTARCPG
jgi:hypothetical protein